jgi:hypothetical protein
VTLRQTIENLEMIGLNHPSWQKTIEAALKLIHQGEKRKRLVENLQMALAREVAARPRSRRKADQP